MADEGAVPLGVWPVRPRTVRLVVGLGVALCIGLNAVELGRSGLDAERWGLLADLSEVVAPLIAAYLLIVRSRASNANGSSESSRAGWLWLAAGAVAWAAGQVTWMVIEFGLEQDSTVSVSSFGFAGWSLCTAVGLVKIARLRGAWSSIRPVVGEAAILGLSIGFLVWELALAPVITNQSNETVVGLALVPLSSSFVVAIALLLAVQHRSRVMGLVAVAGTVLIAGDSFLTTRFANGANVYAAAHALYLMTFVLMGLAAAADHQNRRQVIRSNLVQLCIVYLPSTCAMGIATWHFLLNSREATVVSIGIALTIGAVLLLTQIAHWMDAEVMASRLDFNANRLRATERQLRDLIDDLPEAIVVLSGDGVVLDLNAPTLQLTGRGRDEIVGRYFVEVVPRKEHQWLGQIWTSIFEGHQVPNPVFAIRHVDGSRAMVEADIRLPVSNPDRVVVTLRDITQRLKESAELEQAQAKFRLAFRSAPTGMALASADDLTLVDVNDAFAELLGYSPGALVGRQLRELTHPDDRDRTHSGGIAGIGGSTQPALFATPGVVLPIINSTTWRSEARYLRHDRQVVWAHTSIGMMEEGSGRDIAIVHIQDITQQRKAAADLQWAASHDELTGLPNRTHFLKQLRRRLEGSQPGSVAVLFIDLDNFKVINDSLGHSAGDELLRTMSDRLRSVVRDRDMLGRFGGDEFIVMLHGLHMDMTPANVAERIRHELSQPLVLAEGELYVTGSVGIAYADRPGVTAEELLRDADAAMYRAKSRGRDRVEAFSPGAHETSVLALRTANDLRRGLERGEIVPYYQPIVELSTGNLTGFEVLARWRHPDRGLLAPDQFLPMAEETGLIVELGASILRSSLAQLAHWQIHNKTLARVSISVNVSGRQLVDSRFQAVVADALVETGVGADSLWLEITESALMSDVKAATIALRSLRSLGLHLSVDDFGTGYSSLTYLKRFPVEAIKVDRQFVNGLGIDAEDTTIVEAVVNLGRSLGLMVVAEGVENPLQLSHLRATGCERAQGYLFGRPRPAALVEAERSSSL